MRVGSGGGNTRIGVSLVEVVVGGSKDGLIH
jgi:hypothetical protein